MLSKGELLSSLLTKEKAEGIQAKVITAKEDWKHFHANLHQKESALEVWHRHHPGHALWGLVMGMGKVVSTNHGIFEHSGHPVLHRSRQPDKERWTRCWKPE